MLAKQLDDLINLAATNLTHLPNPAFEQDPQLGLIDKANLYFTSSVLGMEAISHVIEDSALSAPDDFRLYVNFQRYSKIRFQRLRYEQLGAGSNPVYLFGIPDWTVWSAPAFRYLQLSDQYERDYSQPDLSHNWFVVLYRPGFVSMALLAREVVAPTLAQRTPRKNYGWSKAAPDSSQTQTTRLSNLVQANPGLLKNPAQNLIFRSFEGFWTYDNTMIEQLVQALDGYIAAQD